MTSSAIYSVQATASFVANNDSLAIEITAPVNVNIKIRKIRIMHGDGTDIVTLDYYRKVKLVRESVAGTGGNSYTPINLDDNCTPSVSTVKTNAFTPGTITDTVDVLSIHSVTDFFWAAVDDDDKIVVAPGGIFGVVINPSA